MTELALSTDWPREEHHQEAPLILGNKTAADVTNDVCKPLERKATPLWWTAFLASVTLMTAGLAAIGYEIATGIGTWGLNKTVGWPSTSRTSSFGSASATPAR